MTPTPEKKPTGRGKRQTIGGITFRTKAELEAHIKLIRDRAVPGQPLAPEDEAFMRELLRGHPHYELKAGVGIDHFYVYEIPGTGGQRRFEIMRLDGSIRDVAWRKTIQPPNVARDLEVEVLRPLVRYQMHAFRAARYSGGWTCEICGTLVLYSAETAVDHIPPWTFKRLCADWYELIGMRPEVIEVTHNPGYMEEPSLADPVLAERWRDFHQLNAKLRVLCVGCHWKVHGRKPEAID